MQRKCIVVGGGIAGLSAGIAMRKAGYAVTLYEQAEIIEPLGAALSIWGNAMAGLDWLGCGDRIRENSAQICEVLLARKDGRPLMGPMNVIDADSYLPKRADLQDILLNRLGPENVRLGIAIDDAVEQDGSVKIVTNGQTIDQADLVVAADGIHSNLARKYLGIEPEFAGCVGALGMCEVKDRPSPSGQALEAWSDDDRFGVFEVSQGGRYWFYMRSAESNDAIAEITLEGVQQTCADWPEMISESVLATTSDGFIPIAIHAKPPPKKMGVGRIICIGDAVHPMEPNQGQGACQSIEDAWALGVIATRLAAEDILPELERQRLKRVGKYVHEAALIGRAAHREHSLIRSAIRHLFSITPRAIDQRQLLSRVAPPTYR